LQFKDIPKYSPRFPGVDCAFHTHKKRWKLSVQLHM